jgi:aspartate aminotransferase-like enzyme
MNIEVGAGQRLQSAPANAVTVPADYRLRLPGPAAVPEQVRIAAMTPIVSHRGPEFRAVFGESVEMLRPLFGTREDVLMFGTSGTGVMEAAMANVLSPGDALLVLNNGQFGERFALIAEGMGAAVDRLDSPWGSAPDPAALAARLKEKPYRAVMCIHNESSTGVVADIGAIGAVVRETPALLVVDTVSGVGGVEVRMDDWGVDVLVAGSQKALMCPPGLGFAVVSQKAVPVIEQAKTPRFFFDFRRAKASAAKGETPFTPPVSLISGLREALRMIHAEGLPAVLARHQKLAAALRAGFIALGFPMFPPDHFSPTVTVGVVPDGLDGMTIVRHLYAHYHTVIASQRTKLSGRVIRIGTMGAVDASDILTDLHHLELTLRDLGRTPAPGAGIAAASKVLAA